MKKILSAFAILIFVTGINFYFYRPVLMLKSLREIVAKDISSIQIFQSRLNESEEFWRSGGITGGDYAEIQKLLRQPDDSSIPPERALNLKMKLIFHASSAPQLSGTANLELPGKLGGIFASFSRTCMTVSVLTMLPFLISVQGMNLVAGIVFSVLYALGFSLVLMNFQGWLLSSGYLETVMESVNISGAFTAQVLFGFFKAVIIRDGIVKIIFAVLTGLFSGFMGDRRKSGQNKEIEKISVEYKTLQAQYSRLMMTEKELRKNNDKITTLSARVIAIQSLSKVLGSMLEADAIFHEVIDKTQNVFKAKKCSLWVLDEKRQVLRIKEAFGWKREEAVGLEIPLGEEIIGYAAQSGEPISFMEIKKDFRLTELAKNARVPSMLCAPMKHGNKISGVINIEDLDQEKSTTEDMRLIALLATLSAMALNNAQLHAKTVELANTDGLTKLFNNRFVQQYFDRELDKAKKTGKQISIFMTDIDHFKKFNDTYGHQVGDFVLEETAKMMKTSIRDTDLAARYGGEEFIAVLPNTGVNEAVKQAEILRTNIQNKKYLYKGQNLGVTISIGVATYPDHGDIPQVLIKHADQGLYDAKEGGRNCVKVAKKAT